MRRGRKLSYVQVRKLSRAEYRVVVQGLMIPDIYHTPVERIRPCDVEVV